MSPAPKPAPPPFSVTLTRRDYLTYTWVLALRRPVLLFLMYSFALLFLLSVTGVWPHARVFSLALLGPLVGYVLWVYGAAWLLWTRHPALKEARHYTFKDERYQVGMGAQTKVRYAEVRALGSRRALYLLRPDGTADILPREQLPEGVEAFLEARFDVERSSFL